MQVQGTVADVQGLGQNPPQEFIDFFTTSASRSARTSRSRPGSATRARPSTAATHIVMPAVTGSAATGQASGAAGLVKSFARQEGVELAPNEVKQLLTGTATSTSPTRPASACPTRAPRLGPALRLRLPDLGLALERIDEGKIRPRR